MTESQVVNEWISQGELKGELKKQRQDLLKILGLRFPGKASEELIKVINEQESLSLLEHWFEAAVTAKTFKKFSDALK